MSQLTQRMVKTKRGRLTEYLKEIFQRDSEWGLATFLLHEVHRGEDSHQTVSPRSLARKGMTYPDVDVVDYALGRGFSRPFSRLWGRDHHARARDELAHRVRDRFIIALQKEAKRLFSWVKRRAGRFSLRSEEGRFLLTALVIVQRVNGDARGCLWRVSGDLCGRLDLSAVGCF